VQSDLTSLVYVEKGQVIGTLGVIPRPMQFRGQTVRMAVSTQFMVDPEFRKGPAALSLLRRFFSGPQDLSWTDGAADAVHPLWKPFGGHPAPHYSFQWMRFLRPFAFGREILSRRGNTGINLLTGLLAGPADALVTGLAGSALRPPAPEVPATPVSAKDFFAYIQKTGWKESLHPEYDEASLTWLLGEVAKAPSGGVFRCMLAPGKDDWAGGFVYSAKPGGAAYLLHIGSRRRELFGATLEAFLHDAWQQGCSVVRGYGMSTYQTPLTEHGCIFRHPGSCALVQSRNADIVNAVLSGDASFSRLDGECWLRFAGEDWA
jgi:hypothetical protein